MFSEKTIACLWKDFLSVQLWMQDFFILFLCIYISVLPLHFSLNELLIFNIKLVDNKSICHHPSS